MVEWPLIGLFAIWIWNRFRTHGTVIKGLGGRWRAHVADYGKTQEAPRGAAPPAADPDLEAWRGHVDDLHRREPPGVPPAG